MSLCRHPEDEACGEGELMGKHAMRASLRLTASSHSTVPAERSVGGARKLNSFGGEK